MKMYLIRSLALPVLLLSSASSIVSATVSRQECENQGGQVVGDIGNGAIFSPNYVCENSGEAPTAIVVPEPGEPIATEGEVCCGGTASNASFLSEADCQARDGVVIEDVADCNGFPPIGVMSATGRSELAGVQQVCCPNDVNDGSGIGLPLPDPADREETTRDDCLQEYGGEIVGDIGNGAIFKASYRCESNGLPPIANIIQDFSTGNIAIEGEVCCGAEVEIVQDTLPPDGTAERDIITREECIEDGGEIVGDIGDGSTLQPDYVCESNGESPIANIGQGDPIATEGEVCCASVSLPNDGSGSASFNLPPVTMMCFFASFAISMF